jgi:hypothetical protein
MRCPGKWVVEPSYSALFQCSLVKRCAQSVQHTLLLSGF